MARDPLRDDDLPCHFGFTISADLTKELHTCCKAVLDEKSDAERRSPHAVALAEGGLHGTLPDETKNGLGAGVMPSAELGAN